jgi:hypothetical protein
MRSIDMRMKAKLCHAQAELMRDDPAAKKVLIEAAEVWEEIADQWEELERQSPELTEKPTKTRGHTL